MAIAGDESRDLADYPELLFVPDLARLLQITPRALRQRAARGQVPAPMRLGKALAWTRGSVVAWLRDCGRSARPVAMKITLRPYAHDKARWHVDVRLMNPSNTEREIRRRLVAPSGLSEAQARAWGELQVHSILREALGSEAAANTSGHRQEVTTERTNPNALALAPLPASPPSSPTRSRPKSSSTPKATRQATPPASPPQRAELTLAELYERRFEPEHVALQKPATQGSYAGNFRCHIGPHLGELPLSAIDEDRLSGFRAALRRQLGARTVNLVIAQLAKMLRFAKKVHAVAALPVLEKLPTPRSRPKDVYSDAEIAALLKTAAAIDPSWELVCLLALDAGLRVSEICALEWRDVDLESHMLTIQHNVFEGRTQTPKGTIGKVAMSAALQRAMQRHRRREPVGPLVIYRRNHKTGLEWRPHTRHSITNLLHRIQQESGLRRSGPHLLRHTALTRLSNLGASVYVIQAVARHSDLQTTQAYLHTLQSTQTVEAAHLLDQAAIGKARGKKLAKRAKSRKS